MEIIAQQQAVGKPFLSRLPDGVLTVAVVVLASAASFGLGMLAGRGMGEDQGPIQIEDVSSLPAAAVAAPVAHVSSGTSHSESISAPAASTPTTPVPATTGKYVASKNGTKYYLPTCGTVKRINEENKVWFQTKEQAEAAGFAPAANCPGL